MHSVYSKTGKTRWHLKTFFTPHHVVHCCTNVTRGHYSSLGHSCTNVIGSRCSTSSNNDLSHAVAQQCSNNFSPHCCATMRYYNDRCNAGCLRLHEKRDRYGQAHKVFFGHATASRTPRICFCELSQSTQRESR